VLQQDEGASFGAALQALSVLDGGRGGDLADLVEQHLVRNQPLCCEPDSAAVSCYDEAYGRYQRAVSAFMPLYV
jgi:sugar (pentulose or hexulose) kinase